MPVGNRTLERRFASTLSFLEQSLPPPARLLDLGAPNALGDRLSAAGYTVINTAADLDQDPECVRGHAVDAVTAFEILEHLVAPFNVLRAIDASRLFATVPLRLWFATAYRSDSDAWDRHFHEFEDWQFDWLLKRSGWRIVNRAKWVSYGPPVGFRPILRRFTPRYYAVDAVRM